MLAIINLDNNKIDTFALRSRFNFTKNGSFHITDVQQEDVGNYTYKIIFKSGRTETHMVTLTLTSVHQPAIVTQIVMPVSLGVSGLVLLVGVVLIIIKCRKKLSSTSTPEQSIYANLDYTKKEDPKRKRKRKT
ncbi:hypothetical protein NFI96_011256 [Prochilodus magdalenae]|nr:hypothetical protein NFI96_011256 [Prochilodus magdalenae]